MKLIKNIIMEKILIIEDDSGISKGLEESLSTEGYEIVTESDGEKGFAAALNNNPDLLILDLMLPSKSGLDICKDLRMEHINTPIIMLTAKTSEMDKVLGLELGADDYVTKPFSMKELTARIKALLRRRKSIHYDFETFAFDDLKIDFKKMETTKGEKKIKLSLKEYELLKYFIINADEVVSRNRMLEEVWGYEVYPTTRTVDNYILMLRKKIESNPSVPKHLVTIHTAGYKFVL